MTIWPRVQSPAGSKVVAVAPVVMFSFTIFSGSSLRVTAYYIKSMFGLNHLPFANNAVSYILTTNYLLLLCSFFCATSLSSLVGKFVHNKLPRLADLLGTVVYLAVFAAAVSFCV